MGKEKCSVPDPCHFETDPDPSKFFGFLFSVDTAPRSRFSTFFCFLMEGSWRPRNLRIWIRNTVKKALKKSKMLMRYFF
jgi:hypothetical protein